MKKSRQIFLLFSLLLSSQISFSAEILKFSTLEWSPYLGEKIPKLGFGVEILKLAFKAEGYDNIEVEFLPWSRALAVVENKEGYAGCLLAYYSKERAEKFIYSDPVISGPIKFAMRNDKIIPWRKLEDLKDRPIGVVQDYVNSPELDRLFAEKKLFADNSISDTNNLEKLAQKRTDIAVVDANVFTYLLKTNPQLKPFENKLSLDQRTLDDKKLYILFSKSKEGRRLADIFNKGLKKIKPAEIARKYMSSI